MSLTPERIREIVKRYRPKGWRVRESKHRWKWSSALASWERRTLYVPTLIDDDSLFLFLHEVGHVRSQHFHINLPHHREEFEAERFAVHIFRTEGIPVTKLILSDLRGRLCVAIERDIAKKIPIQPHIARWAKHGCYSDKRRRRQDHQRCGY